MKIILCLMLTEKSLKEKSQKEKLSRTISQKSPKANFSRTVTNNETKNSDKRKQFAKKSVSEQRILKKTFSSSNKKLPLCASDTGILKIDEIPDQKNPKNKLLSKTSFDMSILETDGIPPKKSSNPQLSDGIPPKRSSSPQLSDGITKRSSGSQIFKIIPKRFSSPRIKTGVISDGIPKRFSNSRIASGIISDRIPLQISKKATIINTNVFFRYEIKCPVYFYKNKNDPKYGSKYDFKDDSKDDSDSSKDDIVILINEDDVNEDNKNGTNDTNKNDAFNNAFNNAFNDASNDTNDTNINTNTDVDKILQPLENVFVTICIIDNLTFQMRTEMQAMYLVMMEKFFLINEIGNAMNNLTSEIKEKMRKMCPDMENILAVNEIKGNMISWEGGIPEQINGKYYCVPLHGGIKIYSNYITKYFGEYCARTNTSVEVLHPKLLCIELREQIVPFRNANDLKGMVDLKNIME